MSDSEKRGKNNDSDYEGVERRRAERVKGIVVEYKMHDSGDAPRSIFLRDISSAGLSVSVLEKLGVGAVLDLNIYLTDVVDPVVVEAEIRWVKISEYFQKEKKTHYDMGLRFCGDENQDFKLIDEYVKRHKEK